MPNNKQFTFRKYYLEANTLINPREYTTETNPQKIIDFQQFYSWAESNGASWKWIQYPTYFVNRAGFTYPGVLLTHDVDCNQDFVYIPFKLLLTSGKAWKSDLQPFFLQNPKTFQTHPLFEENIIITFIINEKNKKEKSFWSPMFKIWPTQVNTLRFLSAKFIDLYEDKFLAEYVNDELAICKNMFNNILEAATNTPDLIDPKIITLESFIWAYECLHSRCFNNSAEQYNIGPLAEFINHDNVHSHYYISSPHKTYDIFPYDNAEVSSGVESDFEVAGNYYQSTTKFETFIKNLDLASNDEIRLATYIEKLKKGSQAYISYKKVPNLHLLCTMDL